MLPLIDSGEVPPFNQRMLSLTPPPNRHSCQSSVMVSAWPCGMVGEGREDRWKMDGYDLESKGQGWESQEGNV